MQKNVGTVDRVIRVLLGLGLLSIVFFAEGSARWFGLIGLVPLVTASFGYCPPYALFGINTCGVETKE